MTATQDPARPTLPETSGRPTIQPAGAIRSRRLLFWGVYAGFLGLLAFVAVRVCLWLMYAIPPMQLTNKVDPYQLHYDELFEHRIVQSQPDGETARVLLLGGSVAEQTGGPLEQMLIARLERPVRVFNASRSAHTTRDSLNKLDFLEESGTSFDLILVYHGINDVSLNCAPRTLFREDYTHFGWYQQFEQLRATGRIAVGGVLDDAVSRLNATPEDRKLDWGDDVKTPPVFEANLRELLTIAQRQETPLMLMTFAVHIPENYTNEAYYAGDLDYAKTAIGHSCATWGKPENVRKTVAAHNEAVLRVVADCPECPFIDMASLLEGARDFYDVCHLTDEGVQRFAEHVVQKIVDEELLAQKAAPDAG